MNSRYPELFAMTYLSRLWAITATLCAQRVSAEIAAAVQVNLAMCNMLLHEYYERPQAQILTFERRA